MQSGSFAGVIKTQGDLHSAFISHKSSMKDMAFNSSFIE